MNNYDEAFERIKTFCNSENGYPYNQYLQSSTPRNADLDCIENALKDYRKQVWHKVADGDLPCDNYPRILFVTDTGTRFDGFYDNEDKSFYAIINGISYLFKDVIAWTELPEYKE